MDKKMTVFFSKNTGNIEGIFEDEISFENAFYERHLDVMSYCLKAVIEYDINVLSGASKYRVDLEKQQIVLKEEYQNKPINIF